MGRPVYLPRLLSKWGFCSRKAAERLVVAGRVAVDGRVRRNVLFEVDPDRVRVAVDGQRIGRAELLYAAFHKPRGVVTTMTDPRGRPSVADLLPEDLAGAMPVGRLDRDSSGLLLLTNDHDLGNRVAGEAATCDKVYRVTVKGRHAAVEFEAIRRGSIELDGRRLKPAAVRVTATGDVSTTAEIRLRQGRNRQIRRSLKSLGMSVVELERIAIGGVRLGSLEPGAARRLTPQELASLRGESRR